MLLVLPKNLLFILPPLLGSNGRAVGKAVRQQDGEKSIGGSQSSSVQITFFLRKKRIPYLSMANCLHTCLCWSSHTCQGGGMIPPASLPHSMFPSQE